LLQLSEDTHGGGRTNEREEEKGSMDGD